MTLRELESRKDHLCVAALRRAHKNAKRSHLRLPHLTTLTQTVIAPRHYVKFPEAKTNFPDNDKLTTLT